MSLKGAVEQEVGVPGLGSVKPEAYVKLSANKLTETEQLAIDARMTENAAQLRDRMAERRDALDRMMERRREALGG